MEKLELEQELDFIREQIPIYKAKGDNLEGKNWKKNISNDFDKQTLYNGYKKIQRELEALLSHQYDVEQLNK